MLPRQSGKNEAVAQLLVYLLNLLQRAGGQMVYGATADALGRVLAEPVCSTRTLPPADCSAMDGYAVRAADLGGASAQAPVANMAGVSQQSREGFGLYRFLHRADAAIQGALRVCHSCPRASADSALQRDRAPDRRLDGPTDRRSVPVGDCSQVRAA